MAQLLDQPRLDATSQNPIAVTGHVGILHSLRRKRNNSRKNANAVFFSHWAFFPHNAVTSDDRNGRNKKGFEARNRSRTCSGSTLRENQTASERKPSY
jgi:hypothetical protein